MEAATALKSRESATGQGPASATAIRDALAVTATFLLSEEGRKASLLGGGDGRAVQELKIAVPASRLHLVSVDSEGVARLKLRPRYQLDGDRGVTRVDAPPTYDAPPDLDELFREAARNHQLEEAFYVARRSARSKRRDVERERRAQIAQKFLDDLSQRALAHPPPTEKRCHISSDQGRMLFDADTDDAPARLVPAEAHRRFRADLRARKDRNRQSRVAQLAVHEEKKRFLAEWIAAHGSPEQKARQAANVLPIEEAIESIADVAFAAIGDKLRYRRDGVTRLQAHLQRFPEYAAATVSASELSVTSSNASKVTPGQWALVQEIQNVVPDATVVVREHRFAWKRNAQSPMLTAVSILVTVKRGPLMLRREYDALKC